MENQNPAPQAPQTVNIVIPQVQMKDVDGFAKVWNKGGIVMMLDNTSKEFAKDFANIVLKSFVLDQMKQAMKVKAMQEAAVQPPATPVSSEGTTAPKPSGILLTD
jgi:hypothetical protein